MPRESVSYRTAQSQVEDFANQGELMQRHFEAIECLDCQNYLQLGIQAYEWLKRADEEYRKAVREGRAEPELQTDEAVTELYRRWLAPVKAVEKWITVQYDRDFVLDNLEEFNACVFAAYTTVNEIEKMEELAKHVPSATDLDLIAIPPPQEWLDEPPWSI